MNNFWNTLVGYLCYYAVHFGVMVRKTHLINFQIWRDVMKIIKIISVILV
jgi:hypothetical protein